MKTIKYVMLLAGLAGGLSRPIVCLAADSPDTNAPAPAVDAAKTNAPESAVTPAEQPAPPTEPANGTPQPTPEQNAAATAASASDATNVVVLANGEPGLIMNFRGVPLERVLDYMSTAAGFIINPEVSVKGNVDVWSNQPLSKDDSVALLRHMLEKNGYGVLRDDRILTIVTREAATRRDTPVRMTNDFASIPKDAEIVTQIIPVHSLNAVQLVKDLAPLLPTDTSLSANDAGNSLIITDTQANIRRIMEIIHALDSVSSSINTLKVFPLKFADAKSLVTVLTTIFPSQNTTGGAGGFGRFRGGGGGPFGGFNPFGGGPGGNNPGDGSTGHTPTTRVSATSDDHSNSLIVSAPEDLMSLVEEMVKSLDQPVEASTEVRVFHLKNADPTEMCNLLTSLYPDDSNSTDASRSAPQFGGFRGALFGGFQPGGGRQGNTGSSETSDRMKRLARVIAVPDARTASVVVTAARDQMPDIEKMIMELDSNPARKQHVYVFSLQNADPQDAQTVLQSLFQSSTGSSSRSGYGSTSSQNNNPLSMRQTQAMQNSSSSSSPFGSGFGSGGGGGRSSIP